MGDILTQGIRYQYLSLIMPSSFKLFAGCLFMLCIWDYDNTNVITGPWMGCISYHNDKQVRART